MDVGGISNRAGPVAADAGVAGAIKGAANATGTSFEYLLAAARAESGLSAQAAATTSTARGLYQFIDQTWLATMKRSGPSLGYGAYADAIVETGGGRFEVPNPLLRQNILALRDDPAANAALAGALTRNNAAALAARLGREASEAELYIAHVLGAAGATKLLTLGAVSPGAPADAAFPAAAEANRGIFYDASGRARSVAQVYGLLVDRYNGARGLASAPAPVAGDVARATAVSADAGTGARGVSNPIVTAAPVPAEGAGSLALSAAPAPDPPPRQETLFRGLFSDRREAVSQFVQDLWAARTVAGGTPAAPAKASSAASLIATSGSRPLFQYRSSSTQGDR
jgi:hypothetical protein